jgi:hypothetical protein
MRKHRFLLPREVRHLCPRLVWCCTYYLSTWEVRKNNKKTKVSGLKLEKNVFLRWSYYKWIKHRQYNFSDCLLNHKFPNSLSDNLKYNDLYEILRKTFCLYFARGKLYVHCILLLNFLWRFYNNIIDKSWLKSDLEDFFTNVTIVRKSLSQTKIQTLAFMEKNHTLKSYSTFKTTYLWPSPIPKISRTLKPQMTITFWFCNVGVFSFFYS